MAGDPENVALWADADVYVGDTDAINPADIDADFGVTWDLVGLLDGDGGFVESRDEDKTDFSAWGVGVIKTKRKNFKLTKKFTVLEDNETTRSLIWPGSTDDVLIVPRPGRIKIAFETREGDVKRRRISYYQAEVDTDGDLTENETDLTKVPLVATIFPDGDGNLWLEQRTEAAS